MCPDRKIRSSAIRPSVPLVLATTLAVSLNVAAPAAADVAKTPRSKLPLSATPTPKSTAPVAAVPASPTPPPPSYAVVAGDTISGIASRHGLSTGSVLALNGLSASAIIFPGQVIALAAEPAPLSAPPAPLSAVPVVAVSPAPAPAEPAPPAPASVATHAIAAGETVGGVAARSGVPVQSVLDANGLTWSSIIYPGQVLIIPAPVPAVAAAAPAPAPPTEGPATTVLSEEMRGNARAIIAAGRQAGVGDQALVIALAAAAQESGLRNVGFGDRDSLGLFQQRPSTGWGTPDQIMDPTRSALAFFGGPGNPNADGPTGLLDHPGWELMTVTQAAQAVQVSAHPDYYAKWEAPARTWLAELG